eukprot:913066-Ditylum_brightwellii.AAC.1
MVFIMIVATIHVITVEEESKDLRREMRLISEGVQMMYEILSAVYECELPEEPCVIAEIEE